MQLREGCARPSRDDELVAAVKLLVCLKDRGIKVSSQALEHALVPPRDETLLAAMMRLPVPGSDLPHGPPVANKGKAKGKRGKKGTKKQVS